MRSVLHNEIPTFMNLDHWTLLEPTEFQQQLLKNRCELDTSIVDIYNALIQQANGDPLKVAKLAETAVEVFDSVDEPDEVLLFLELLARCRLADGDLDSALSVMERITASGSDDAETVALELVQEIVGRADTFGASVDRLPKILSQLEPILQHYGKHEVVAELYIRAAFIYSGHGASQAAYRCIGDAEQLAHTLQSGLLLARCHSAVTAVACDEPDYQWAVGAGKRAIEAYRQTGLIAPADLLSNLGVAHMNLDELEQATDYFERALACEVLSAALASAIRLNLSICLRRLDRVQQAEDVLTAVEATSALANEPEHALELVLAAAKLASVKGDNSALRQRLHAASGHLADLLARVLRLHHRRGVRERYIARIEGLLRSLPPSGTAADALSPIVAVRGNAMGDWLMILSWATQLKKEANFSLALANRLDNILGQIRNLGAPHLYGFREKYDDPWSVGDFGGVWDELSQLCAEIGALGLPRPLNQTSARDQVELCKARLAQNHCLMFTTYAGDSALLWYFIGDQYRRVNIPLQPLLHWHRAQLEYAEGTRSPPGSACAFRYGAVLACMHSQFAYSWLTTIPPCFSA